jgi:hypothetical protein
MVTAMARARGIPHWQVGISPALARSVAARLPGPPGSMDLLGTDHAVDPGPFVEATGVELTPLVEGMRRFWAARRRRDGGGGSG